ncbi:MAG: hypothetical protein H7308_14465 [Chthonomonadaceae bacterium]|nr:hypothetical protein [Chthonomonadaceae bacterium]
MSLLGGVLYETASLIRQKIETEATKLVFCRFFIVCGSLLVRCDGGFALSLPSPPPPPLPAARRDGLGRGGANANASTVEGE